MAITRLLINDLRHRKTRCFLTIAAVGISVSLVVAMTSGFASLKATAYQVLGTFYGQVDVTVEPREEDAHWFDERLVQAIRADPRVVSVRTQLTARGTFGNDLGQRTAGPVELVGMEPVADPTSRRPLLAGRWFHDEAIDEVVLDETLMRWLRLPENKVGVGVVLQMPGEPPAFTVTGVSARPGVFRIDLPTAYLPLATLQEILDRPGQVNVLEIDVASGVDADAFAADLERLQVPGNPPMLAKTVATQQARFDRNFQGLELLSYLGGTVSMIAAVFIIFSTLSMGVTERSRVLAILRAIGAERSHIVRLVLAEGAILGLIGSLCGVALGYLWLRLLVGNVELFTSGVVLSGGGILYGIIGSVVAALLASALPAIAASRVSPLDAMAIAARERSSSGPWGAAVLGMALLAIDPLIVFAGGLDRELRIVLHLYVGLPCFMLGLFAISPAVVLLVDRLFGPIAARLLWIQPALLRQQLSGGLWRSAGTAAALMVGLAVLVLIRIHGNNMVGTWQLPDRFPDMLAFSLLGMTQEQAEQLDTIDGVAEGQVLPVALVSPKVGANIFGMGGLVQAPDATILFGVDARRAFGDVASADGAQPMIELQFIEGDPATAARRLTEGRYMLVSEEFKTLKGLGVGDRLELETTINGRVEYTIAGVVRSPGVDLIVRIFQMDREFDQWTSAAVATDLSNLQRDFGVNRFHLLAANLMPGDREETEKAVRRELQRRGLIAAGAATIKKVIDFGFRRILDLSSSVALMAILVASVGVTNTIMASVRSRRWQLGILRSIGLTRSALLRLVIAEALLIAVAACILGIGGGLLLSYLADATAGLVMGVRPPFTFLAGPLIFGSAITVLVAAVAGLWPALRVALTAPLRLLQAGRASA